MSVAERLAKGSVDAAEQAERRGKGIRLDLRLRVYDDGKGFVEFADGADPVLINDPLDAVVWLAQTWKLLHRRARNET